MAERPLSGAGRALVPASREQTWSALLRPDRLRAIIPGAEDVELHDDGRYLCLIVLRVGPLRLCQRVELELSNLDPPRSFELSGTSNGAFGSGRARGRILLSERGRDRTEIVWTYAGSVFGAVTIVGGAVLRRTSAAFVSRVFQAMSKSEFHKD